VSAYAWNGKKPVHPCACGCGTEVSIATRSDRRNGQVKGQPLRYVSGHNNVRRSPVPPAAGAEPTLGQVSA
jgi:hypothetical protein